jgi:hypothetical protein
MKNFTKKILAVATMATLGAGVTATAHAGSLAYSNLNILGIKFLDHDTGTQLDVSDLSALNFTNTSTNSASLASMAGTPSSTDFTQVCQGNCAVAEDTFGEQALGTHFARADSALAGTIISGLGAGATGATASTVGETQLTANDTGIGNSNIQLNAGFQFQLGSATTIAFAFDASGGIHAKQNPENNVPPSNAQANVNFTITIIDATGAAVFAWSPDGATGNATLANDTTDDKNLNDNLAAAFAGQDFSRDLAGSFYASSLAALDAAQVYTLTINHTSDVAATKDVPEPATLALFGLGLAGFAAFRRRKA